MNWLVLAGSLGAVLLLAAIAWWLKLGPAPVIADPDNAKRLARDAHSGFRPAEAACDASGRAAIVRGDDGVLVLLRPHGARIAARALKGVRATRDGGTLSIATGERMFGDVTLTLGEAEARRWADMLEARHA